MVKKLKIKEKPPKPKSIIQSCPKCNEGLSVSEDVAFYTCQFCGAELEIYDS